MTLFTAMIIGLVLGSYFGLVSSRNLANADITGFIATGTEESVESTAWVRSGTHKDQSECNLGSDDRNVRFPPVEIPPTSGFVSYSNRTVGNRGYNFVLDTGSYEVTGPKGLTGDVLVRGDVTLYVPYDSSLNFSGDQKITILPGATLRLYVGCQTATWMGGADIDNQNVSDPKTQDVRARHFQYFGLPTNTSIHLTRISGFIYAPNADLTVGGSGQELPSEQPQQERQYRKRPVRQGA